ncbi:hypothetical protein ANRL1_04561 [Anaerolineae bacterium]|nr:hypothetical protein ANRL1_04561 [Anaerolineae bacterium]
MRKSKLVYLRRFHRPHHHAKNYLGITNNLERRLTEHATPMSALQSPVRRKIQMTPRIIITIQNGSIYQVKQPNGIEVEIRDLDTEDDKAHVTRWVKGECVSVQRRPKKKSAE